MTILGFLVLLGLAELAYFVGIKVGRYVERIDQRRRDLWEV